jgi:hypothetical protein
VHNALDRKQVDLFRELRKSDSLYDIRFFEPDEIRRVMERHCARVELYPFGNRLLDRSIKYLNRVAPLKQMYRRLSTRDIRESERIMAVGYLN